MMGLEKIYKLSRKGEFKLALNELLDNKTKEIKAEYCNEDMNHVWYVVGDLYFRIEKYHKAAEAFQKALLYDAYDDYAYNALGLCYQESGDFQKAIEVYEESIKLFDNPSLLYNLGNTYFDLKNYEKAIQNYEKVFLAKEAQADAELLRMTEGNMYIARARLKEKTKTLKKNDPNKFRDKSTKYGFKKSK